VTWHEFLCHAAYDTPSLTTVSLNLDAVTFDAGDPDRLARFWGGVLGWEPADDPEGAVALAGSAEAGFGLRFRPTGEPKALQNRIHFDLTSASAEEMQETVARALSLGASHLDIGQRAEEGHVVLADPDGNEFCVLPPGNSFLAGCGFVGAVNCDGSQEVGYFWSEALGWPLVWDQDEETAIQAPRGGPKMAWGGPPLMPKPPKNRLHLDLATPEGGDQRAEVERLLSLGAKRIDIGQGEVSWAVMVDPDGNEFCVRDWRR
jgi:catechol 2,3-dioxygenase-like lactoylglutathione lyase family enzyme